MTALSASPTLSSPQEPFPEKEEDALPLPELTMPHTLYCHKTNPLVRISGLGIANSVGISSKAPQMKLQLNRPLIFFDIEATGLNIASDRIVELCYIKCFPDGTEKVHTQRFNPGKHISEEASKVNGIYDADVAECPTFKSMAGNIAKDFENCDLAGFNSIVLNDQGVETINFGKYRGRPVTEVLRRDPGYFGWVMQGDFTQNTKQTFMRIKLNAGI